MLEVGLGPLIPPYCDCLKKLIILNALHEHRWLVAVGCRIKANCLLLEPRPAGRVPSMGGLSKGETVVSEKTTKNSELQGRQARPGI